MFIRKEYVLFTIISINFNFNYKNNSNNIRVATTATKSIYHGDNWKTKQLILENINSTKKYVILNYYHYDHHHYQPSA